MLIVSELSYLNFWFDVFKFILKIVLSESVTALAQSGDCRIFIIRDLFNPTEKVYCFYL